MKVSGPRLCRGAVVPVQDAHEAAEEHVIQGHAQVRGIDLGVGRLVFGHGVHQGIAYG